MIIDERYFTYPETYIAGIETKSDGVPAGNAPKIIGEINAYIRKYEPRFLRDLLGRDVADSIDKYPEIRKLLANEMEGTSVIAKYVYFMYSRDKMTFNTVAGEKLKNTENSTRTFPVQRLVRVWNDMVDECWGIVNSIEDVEVHPNFRASIFDKINVFGL